MASNFYIAGNTVIEACLSLTPIEQARKAVKNAEQNNWVFPTNDKDLPMIDVMIVAYLPNEKDIIMDRTLYAVQRIVYPTDRFRISIVYNTPKPIPELQKELHDLTAIYSNLRVMQVPNSRSKADNVNYFLSLDIQTDMIAIFDCDHYPHPYGPRWAAERFCQSTAVDVVQGRCVIFNAATSFLTSMIAVEFDKIYAVSHPGRAEMWQFGLFCGSNGYCKSCMYPKCPNLILPQGKQIYYVRLAWMAAC
jgi:cellulose synthase/poly-beta-1,6-N-acetylglucosamine synthase-like glycosyltransferase